MHKLAIVAVIGLSASAVCMGAAAAIGGNEFGKGLDGLDLPIFSDLPRCENGGGYPINRTLDWDGSDHAGIAIPGRATYAPGNDDKLHVSGNPVLVPHVRVRDGKIELDCRNWHDSRKDLEITLPGREFKKFSVSGSGSLTLQNLDQMMVKISVSGSGSVKADGKVEHAEIRVSGSGDADLSQLKTNIATVRISGSGSSAIAPIDEADIRVSGSGDVNLHSNPKRLETHISGSGRIHNITG
jgi:hypothetical protein